MQAFVEDRFDTAVAQHARNGAGLGTTVQLFAIFRCDLIRAVGDIVIAKSQTARQLPIEEQEFGDRAGRRLAAHCPAIGTMRGYGAQDRLPLHIVEAGADADRRRQKDEIFYVHDPGRAVRPLDKGAETSKMKAIIAQQRAEHRAAHQGALTTDQIDHVRQIAVGNRRGQRVLQRHPAFVDRFPHFTGERSTHQTGIVACHLDHAEHTRWVLPVPQHPVDDLRLPEFVIFAAIGGPPASGGEHGRPLLARGGTARHRNA